MPVQGFPRSVVLETCSNDGEAFRYASEEHQDDKEIALAACSNFGASLEFVSERLLDDKDVVLAACHNDWKALKFASRRLRDDTDVVSEACKVDGMALQYASQRLLGDKKLVLLACRNSPSTNHDGLPFYFATDELRCDRDFVYKVCRQTKGWRAIEFCLEEFTSDEDIVWEACRISDGGAALQYAHKNLRNNRSFVMKVCQVLHGIALEHASEELRSDREIVLAAVKSNGMALAFASNKLRATKDIVLVAVKSDPEALKFALGGLNQNKDCLIAANLWDKDYQQNDDLGNRILSSIKNIFMNSKNKRQIILSTKFSLSAESSSHATRFAVELKRHPYISWGNFNVYSPNAFNKETCDPNWTDRSWPCRGTYDTCKKDHKLKIGKPTDECCWRYSFRYHLEEARDSNGFMIQVIDYQKQYHDEETAARAVRYITDCNYHFLGAGQMIEAEMAKSVKVKMFKFFQPENMNRYNAEMNELISCIKTWYESNCENMAECNCGHDDLDLNFRFLEDSLLSEPYINPDADDENKKQQEFLIGKAEIFSNDHRPQSLFAATIPSTFPSGLFAFPDDKEDNPCKGSKESDCCLGICTVQ